MNVIWENGIPFLETLYYISYNVIDTYDDILWECNESQCNAGIWMLMVRQSKVMTVAEPLKNSTNYIIEGPQDTAIYVSFYDIIDCPQCIIQRQWKLVSIVIKF